MKHKLVLVMVWILSLTASAGESLVRISHKVFSVKHEEDIEVCNLSSNQLIDLLKSNEVYELKYSPLGKLIKKNRIKLGTWTETSSKTLRPGSWTETGVRVINSKNINESFQNRGE